MIWDTAGQEIYKSITKIYYQKSDTIIFVNDITNAESNLISEFYVKLVAQPGMNGTIL